MSVDNIIKGRTSMLDLSKNISEVRMNICKVCPIYSPKFGGICNNRLWLNPETNSVAFSEQEGYVRGCGCRLSNKVNITNESCIAGKW